MKKRGVSGKMRTFEIRTELIPDKSKFHFLKVNFSWKKSFLNTQSVPNFPSEKTRFIQRNNVIRQVNPDKNSSFTCIYSRLFALFIFFSYSLPYEDIEGSDNN